MKARKLFLTAMTIASVMLFNACEEDPCKDVTCTNGTPTELLGSCHCECDAGYEGNDCGTVSRDKFIGNFTANDNCASASYDVEIVTSSSGVDKILVKDFGKFLCNGDAPDVVASVDEGALTIASQTFCSGYITISGTGTISSNSNTITITYATDTTGGSGFNCTAVLTRQ